MKKKVAYQGKRSECLQKFFRHNPEMEMLPDEWFGEYSFRRTSFVNMKGKRTKPQKPHKHIHTDIDKENLMEIWTSEEGDFRAYKK